MSKLVVLAAGDPTPSRVFVLLEEALKKEGFEVDAFLGHGKLLSVPAEEGFASIEASDLVLTGMSGTADRARLELSALLTAHGFGKKMGLFSDTIGCWAREWFVIQPWARDIDILFVLNEKEARDAVRVYQKAMIIPSGNPLWEESGKSIMTRGDARMHLQIPDDDILILVPFTKDAGLNFIFAGLVINAAALIQGGCVRRIYVVCVQYPGDSTPHETYQKSILTRQTDVSVRIVPKDILPMSHVLACADLLCWNTPGSTGSEAGFRRVPTIACPIGAIGGWWMENQGIASRTWDPAIAGVEEWCPTGSPERLAGSMWKLLFNDPYRTLIRQNQEKMYIPQEPGTAVGKMVAAIRELLGV